MNYRPVAGGHAPQDLREEFIEHVEDMFLTDGEPSEELQQLAVVLCNCTDIMPSGLCNVLDTPQGSTYAQGARRIRDW